MANEFPTTSKTKGKRTREESEIAQAIKRARNAEKTEEFFRAHGESWWVCIYKTSLETISKPEFTELRETLLKFQFEHNPDLQITKVMEEPTFKTLRLRVHTQQERLTLGEVVKRATNGIYETFCFKDLEEGTELIKIKLPKNFPQYFLTKAKLPTLISQTLGKYLANQTSETEIQVLLPPSLTRDKFNMGIYIAVDSKTYALLKTGAKTLQLVSYKMTMEFLSKKEEKPDETTTAATHLGSLKIKIGGTKE